MTNAKIDGNFKPTLIAVSSVDGETPLRAEINPVTGGLIVDATVTATVDTTGLASDTNQTNGSQKTQIVDAGGEAATVTGGKLDVNATASLAGTALPISGATEAVGVAIVDGSGNQITSFGGGTQYTEDAAAAANPVGTALNMVRDDARSGSLTTTDGDNVAARGTNAGELYVKHVDSIPVTDNGGSITVDAASLPLPTGASTSAKQDTGNTSLASIDGKITAVNTGAVVISSSALPSGASTAAKQPALGTAGTASADVITVQGIASMTALKTDGSAVTQPVSAASLPLPTGAATAALQTQPGVDIGDVTINNASGASAVNVQDGGNSITVDAPVGTPAFVRLSDGASAISTLPVSLASVPSHAVTNAGTFVVQESGSALTALQLIDDPVFADDAAYTLSTSKGNVIEGVAVQTDGTDPTAVSAEGDAAALRTDMTRILLVNTTPPRLTSATENNATAQTNNPILSAPGAGLSLYITDIIISNGATAGSIRFVEDTGGTPVIKVQETYMAINGGAVIPLKTPLRITANKDFGYTSTTVTTHSITVSGYIAP